MSKAAGDDLECDAPRIAHNQVFLGSPPEGLTPQSDQVLTADCGEGFLGKAKKHRLGTLGAVAIVFPPQLGLRLESLHSLQNLLLVGIAAPEMKHQLTESPSFNKRPSKWDAELATPQVAIKF